MRVLVASISWSLVAIACGGDEVARDTSNVDAVGEVDGGVDGETGVADTTTDTAIDVMQDGEIVDTRDVAEVEIVPAPVAGEFDPLHLVRVDIGMKPDDWDALRNETRTLFDLVGPQCLQGPSADVFTYKPAEVTIDGVALSDVGVRKKGFLGSLDFVRPSLRLELDELVEGQRLGDLERLTLNNGRQDPSRLKQCLAYQVFRDAGVAAPRCAFASVRVNGEDLGLYIHVESVKKPFLRANFPAPDGAAGDLGQLWEGQLSDFREGWMATFEAKLDDRPDDRDALAAVTTALEASDEELIAALDAVIDLDQFMTFWATEVLVAHWDGYAGNTNNFFVYRAASGDVRLRFIPWGVDGTFIGDAPAFFGVGALAARLLRHPVGRARYIAEVSRLLDEVWDEARYIDLVATWDALTNDAREVPADPLDTSVADDVAALKVFITTRRAALEAKLLTLAEEVDALPPLRDAPCAKASGTVAASFATRWNTLAIDDLFATGDGTFELDSAVLPELTFARIGSKAGNDPNGAPAMAQIVMAATVVGAGYIVVLVDLARPLVPGTRVLGSEAQATVYYLETDGTAQLVGFLGDGELSLEAANELLDDGSGQGSRIEGRFAGTLYTL